MTPLGLAIAGPSADLWGVQTWLAVGGGVCALMGVVGFVIPALMEIETGRGVQEVEPASGV
jgi:hypothetical protein